MNGAALLLTVGVAAVWTPAAAWVVLRIDRRIDRSPDPTPVRSIDRAEARP